MMSMEYKIKIGKYRLGCVDSVRIRKSVESLSDTAEIVLPATYINKSIDIESKLKEGDIVTIELGYDDHLQTEFNGYLNTITTDDSSVKLECEDDIYLFRKEVRNKEMKNVSLLSLLQYVISEIDKSYILACDYDFKYDKFVIKDVNAWDILKKVQDETKANIYFKDKTLHVHPQYKEIANTAVVTFDFARNVEKSSLKYKKADQRKYFVEVESVGRDGKRIVVTVGKQGGERRSIKVYGITDKASLTKRGEQELQQIVYTGFEGNFTGWLVPYCQPTYKILLRDSEYPYKNGVYYVVSTEVNFSSQGGERIISIGKKINE
jgi:hypothetical protein